MSTRSAVATAALAALLVLTSPAMGVHAAAQSIPLNVPLFLVMPQSFPDVDGRFVLLREPGRDLVLLRDTDATPETLSVALRVLGRLNATTPRREREGQMVPVTGYALTVPLSNDERTRLDAALVRLKSRPVAAIGNLGLGRSMPLAGPTP